MCQSAVFKANQCKKRNPVHQRFDVRNWDVAVDTSLYLCLPVVSVVCSTWSHQMSLIAMICTGKSLDFTAIAYQLIEFKLKF